AGPSSHHRPRRTSPPARARGTGWRGRGRRTSRSSAGTRLRKRTRILALTSAPLRYNARPSPPAAGGARLPAAARGAPCFPRGLPMSTQDNWYIERFEPTGSAIGYRVDAKLDEVQSPFQKIEIYRTTDWGNLMLIDGAVMLTSRDNFLYHEMISHPALFTHAAPKRVVIIGG